jgi:predicted RNA-binding Zn ribbon-like protein
MTTRGASDATSAGGPPGNVRLVQDFVNTVEPQTGDEALQSPRDLLDWLVDHDLARPDRPVTQQDLELAYAVREGLRALLVSHTRHDPDEAAIESLNRALQEVAVSLRFDSRGEHRLVAADPAPIHHGLVAILEAIRQATQDQTWNRLKVCARDSCRWAFYDTSRNRAGRWCSMAGCGNHIKMQRAYAARKARTKTAG